MRGKVLGAAVAVLAIAAPAAAQVELDRTLQRVYGTAITASDVRRARALKLAGNAQSDQDVQTELENRLLILREIARATVAEPEPERVSSRRKDWTAGWPAGTDVAAMLSKNGMSEQALDGWCRDDVRIAAYLEQRFGASSDDGREARIASWIRDLRQRANLPAR